MKNTVSDVLAATSERDQQLTRSMEKIFSAAHASSVFSEPVTNGGYTVITACEVAAGGGFGSGQGNGTGPEQVGEGSQSQLTSGGGGGIGGGGFSRGRPIAAIIVGPEGVTIRPILDLTRIALAGIGLWSSVLVLFRKAASRKR
ncbi:MAG TPA: hypothetical protein VFQ30_03540 [Ktedonobacteraceae bacterium]|nr:hypothetical protein [Ktedonobacteraceae bacterium]